MKSEDIDWKVLRGALIGFVVSVIVGGSLIAGGYVFEKRKHQEFNQNNSQFQSISRKYLAVDEEEKQIKQYFPGFLDLHKGGIIGHEERLNWIETLRDASERLRIPSLNYEIRSQAAYASSFPLNLGRYQLYNSEMSLSLQALHEGDLLRLGQLLDTRAKGLYSIHACQMSRTSQTIDTTNGSKSNVNVQCEMNWFTIKLADGTEIKVEI